MVLGRSWPAQSTLGRGHKSRFERTDVTRGARLGLTKGHNVAHSCPSHLPPPTQLSSTTTLSPSTQHPLTSTNPPFTPSTSPQWPLFTVSLRRHPPCQLCRQWHPWIRNHISCRSGFITNIINTSHIDSISCCSITQHQPGHQNQTANMPPLFQTSRPSSHRRSPLAPSSTTPSPSQSSALSSVTPTDRPRPPTPRRSSSSRRRLPAPLPPGPARSPVPPSRRTVWVLSSTPPAL